MHLLNKRSSSPKKLVIVSCFFFSELFILRFFNVLELHFGIQFFKVLGNGCFTFC